MNQYHRDIFYKVPTSLEEQRDILNKAEELSFDWHFDKLDGFQRKQIPDATWEDVLEHHKKDSHFVVIHRRGYDDWKDMNDRWCGEIGYNSGNYYSFIYMTEENLDKLVDLFSLTPM